MKIYCGQMDIVWEDKPANMRHLRQMIDILAPDPGGLLVLPEMFATGFSMNVEGVAESEGAEGLRGFLGEMAQRHELSIIAGLAVRTAEGKAANESWYVGPSGEVLGRYRKLQPFSLGEENRYYVAGDQPVIWDWQGYKVAPFVCYDLRFPEWFRQTSARGAELFVVIANWPSKREQHWVTLLQARAIENQAVVVGVNRCGTDPFHVYSGRSLIVDCHGKILLDAQSQETITGMDVDLEELRRWRDSFPALRDRR